MRRIVALLLALITVASLFGCKKVKVTDPASESTTAPEPLTKAEEADIRIAGESLVLPCGLSVLFDLGGYITRDEAQRVLSSEEKRERIEMGTDHQGTSCKFYVNAYKIKDDVKSLENYEVHTIAITEGNAVSISGITIGSSAEDVLTVFGDDYSPRGLLGDLNALASFDRNTYPTSEEAAMTYSYFKYSVQVELKNGIVTGMFISLPA